MNQAKTENNRPMPMEVLKCIVIGVLFGVILTFFFSLFTYFTNSSQKMLDLGVYLIVILSVLLTSVLSGRKADGKGYLYGLLGSAGVILLLFVINMIISTGNFSILNFFKKVPALLAVGLLGGMVGINMKPRGKRR